MSLARALTLDFSYFPRGLLKAAEELQSQSPFVIFPFLPSSPPQVGATFFSLLIAVSWRNVALVQAELFQLNEHIKALLLNLL